LNPQTVRNYIDRGELGAVRVGRRVRVPRAELDRILAQGVTLPAESARPAVAVSDASDELAQALECARRLLGRRSAARRAELAEGLQQLADAVAAAIELRSDRAGDCSPGCD
jgi:excisionase family DNA binding protein